jgi:hypothetical protein
LLPEGRKICTTGDRLILELCLETGTKLSEQYLTAKPGISLSPTDFDNLLYLRVLKTS